MEVFDWRYYVSRYSDLRDAGVINRKKALNHWNRIGKYENRYPNKKVEEYYLRKQNEQINRQSNYYRNDNKVKEESFNSSFDTNTISLKEIKNIYSNAKMEFTKSEQSSEFQSFNGALLQENNSKINILLNNLKLVYNEILTIKTKLNYLEQQNKILSDNISMSENSKAKKKSQKNVEVTKKVSKKKTEKQFSINEKIVSSDEYSDYEESDTELNEIKYSNSDEFINDDENNQEDDIIDGNFKSLKFNPIIERHNRSKIHIDDIDKIKKEKNVANSNAIEGLIKNMNINDKRKKKKKKKIISLNEQESSEESSISINDNLKEIDNLKHKSILKNLLNKDDVSSTNSNNDEKDDSEKKSPEKKTSNNSIISYLQSQSENISDMVSFDNTKLDKLINNISSKKI